MRRVGHTLLLCLACLCLGPLTGLAAAAPGIESSSLALTTTQAGAHPDLTVSLALEEPGEPEVARNLLVGLPRGYFLYRDLHVRCSTAQFPEGKCPVDSQVGLVTVHGNHEGDPDSDLGTAAVHLLVPEAGQIARFGFVIPAIAMPVEVPVTVSPDNGHGLELAFRNVPSQAPLQSLEFTLWGIPADPVHDEDRGGPSSQPQIPLTRSPTSCGGAGSLMVSVDSYQDPGDFATASSPTPALSGCGNLAFPAALEAGLTSAEAGTPIGLDLTVEIPRSLDPSGLSSSDVREIRLTLPPHLELDEEALPSASSLGSFTAAVQGVEAPIEGEVRFDETEAANFHRLLLVGAGGGIDLSIPAFLRYDETAEAWVFDLPDMPQLPFEELELQVASKAGPFIAPECGALEGASELTPWSGQSPLLGTIEMTIDSGPEGGPCPEPEEPEEPVVTPPPPPLSIIPRPPVALPLPPRKPIVKFRRRPPAQTRDRTPSFRFTSDIAGSTFKCKVDRRPLRPCKSPLTLPRLGLGRHTLKVQATAPSGARSFFASYGFVVR